MELTIGILSYNTNNHLKKCLNSIYKHTKGIKFEVIVVDNASVDGSVEMIKKLFPQVKLIVNKKNFYFAKGYNQIIKISKGKYFLMLNSDTYITNNAFLRLIQYMKNKNIYACEGLELNDNGQPINTGTKLPNLLIDFFESSYVGRLLANKRLINEFRMTSINRKNNYEIDVGCNAYFCVEKKILEEISGFDSNFILYYTEYDMCRRIKEKGYKIYHFGRSFVYHSIAVSTSQLGERREGIYYKDMRTYYTKYSSKLFANILYLQLVLELKAINIIKRYIKS